jgi:hypothetical protein
MKRHIQVSVALALACLLGPIAASAQNFVTLPAGTRLSLVQETTVSSESSNVGDLVVAKTRLNVRDRRGQIVIPAGTEVRGRVTSADPGGKMKGRAVLGITFDRLVLRGEEIPMTTTRIVVRAKSQAKRDAAGVAAGTIGGAVVGGIIGGKKGARIGAVTGAGAGTAAAVSTRGPQVTFAAGSRRLVSLTRSLRVPREVRVPPVRNER